MVIIGLTPEDAGKAPAQHGLSATANDRVENVAAKHRTCRGEEWKVISGVVIPEATTNDEVVVYFGQ